MTLTLSSLSGSSTFAAEAAPQVASAPVAARAGRQNKFAGKCAQCGVRVEAEAGILGDRVDGRWQTFHTVCPTPAAPAAPEAPAEPRGSDDYSEPVWPGTYTVVTDAGHTTFRVDAQAQDADFAPGEVIVSYLSGQDNESDYRGFAFLKGGSLRVWKRFREGHSGLLAAAESLISDPDAALVSKRCLRCSRKLTTPASIAAGIGPECASKGW